MSFTSINGIGLKGLNSDLAAWELSPEFVTSGVNFRSLANKIVSSGSIEDWDAPGAGINAGHLVSVKTTAGDFWLSLGRASVYVYNGATWTDITSVAGYGGLGADDELKWNSCMLGKIPVINNSQHVPEYWDPQSITQVMQPLDFDASNTWSAKGYSAKVIRSHKNILFALNLTEGATEIPGGFRWSHPAAIGGLPYTWDETDASGLAGKAQLGGHYGELLDGLTLRNSFVLYSDSGVNILDYTGDELVWDRRDLSTSYGIAGTNCVAEFKGLHLFLGDGDIIKNDGNRIESVVHNRIRSRLTSQMSADYYNRSYVVRNVALKEIWFCVPEDSAQYPNVAYVYNWKDDSWSIHDLPYVEDGLGAVTTGVSFAAYGPRSDAPETYSTVTGTYDSTSLTYGTVQRTPNNHTVVGVYGSSTSGLTILDPVDTTSGEDTDFFIERTDLLIGDAEHTYTITELFPYMDSEDEVTIQIGSSFEPGGTVNWSNELSYTPGTTRKLDVLSTGTYFSYRVRSVTTGKVALTGMGIKFEQNGLR
jgi:hypothetical protein